MKKKITLVAVFIIVLVLIVFGFNSCSSSTNKSTVKEYKVTSDKKETEEESNETEDGNKSSTVSDDKNKSESNSLPSTTDNKTTTTNTTSKSNTSTSNSKPSTHTHNWVKKVIHHDAVTHTEQVLVSEAWDEPIYETKYASVCNTCGADITGFAPEHLLETEHDSYRCDVPIQILVGYNHHDAVYEAKTIVDKAAYDEVIYTCSCGATK